MEVASQSEVNEGRLSDFVQVVRATLRRRWLTLVIVSAVVFAAGIAATLLLTPRYAGTALVRIDPSRNPLSNQQQQARDQELNPEALETEVALLGSLDVARAVAQSQKLLNDPAFVPQDDKRFDAASPDEKLNIVAQKLLRDLSVNRDKLTYIISIRYTDTDAARAARIANAFADTYLDFKINSNTGSAERQSQFFQKQLDQLGREVSDADARVAQYRARSGLVASTDGQGEGATTADQQVAPLSGQLATAESDSAAARAGLNAAQQQVARGKLDSVAEVRNSPVISDLRRQRAEIVRNQGDVEAHYGPKHPESIRVHDQLTQIDQQIHDEATRAMASLQAASIAADARAGSLKASMTRLDGERARNTEASVMASSLEREAAAKRAAYDKISQMSLESTQGARNQISQAVIIERATTPPEPSFPNKKLMIALAFVVGVAAGVATIIVQEMLVQGMRTIDDVETTLGLPVLAAIPHTTGSGNPADVILNKPTSLFAEALRIARGAILGVKNKAAPQVIAVTSALPSEGKTTTAIAFARTLALNGARTILVECDVRRAQIRFITHKPPTGPGIVELLHGQATIEQVIGQGDVDHLDQILVSAPYFSSEDLFGNGAMEKLIGELRMRYDTIVLDLPPLVGLADGRYLAVQADAVALVVRWASTPPQAAASAVNWLRSDGANPVGVIYTMVDSSAEAIGGLYYSKKYSNYYQQ